MLVVRAVRGGSPRRPYAVGLSHGRSSMTIQRVGVVGFGQMGSGIAQVCAQAGVDTLVREGEQSLLDRGFQRVDGALAPLVQSQRGFEAEAKAAPGPIHRTTSPGEV